MSLVQDAEVTFTCGMHQFDRPDAEIGMQDPRAAAAWLDTFCIYQLLEQPALASGHTFCPDAASTRRVLARWPDARHRPEDGRHNPFGLWRFLPVGVRGLEAVNPVPTIMPSLVAMLTASERAKGAPLTRREVERIVDQAPAIAMAISDAAALERSRGYADIEPRLAWEQRQIVRASLG